MKKEIRFYLLWILVISNLFYQEYWGLNALLVTTLTTLIFAYRFFVKPVSGGVPVTNQQKTHWFIGAAIWQMAALSVFLGNGWLPVFLYLLSLAYFISLQDQTYISFPLAIAQSFQSFATGMIRIITDRFTASQNVPSEHCKKIFRQVLQFSIGLIICIVFLKLYQLADADFYELTRFLNLDWISWGFIAYYVILAWILYGVYFFKPEIQINQAEATLKNDIQPDYQDRIQSFFGAGNEKKLALITLSVLCTMLLLFLGLDARFILNEFGIQRPVSDYSESVHQGVNSLIFSLILVIILISYFFRGSLNFGEHSKIKRLAHLWLFLNCILVITTGLKNYDYILNFGYTYKRLGVLLYLFLCGIGLAFSMYKIYHSKSIWFLIRNTSISFIAAFAFVSLFNWNAIIAQHNLSQVKKERLDLYYLYDLGPDTYPYLMSYHLENRISGTDLFYKLVHGIQLTRKNLELQQSNSTWRSLNLRDYELYRKLKSYHFTDSNAITEQHLSLR